MLYDDFMKKGEYAAAGAFEEPERSLFYRKALGIRRYYENCSLYKYDNKPLYPSGTKKEEMIVCPNYLKGLDANIGMVTDENKNLISEFQKVFCRYTPKVPEEHTVSGNMWCHSMPNYGRIIHEGLNSYMRRIKKMSDIDLRDGLTHIYEGIKCYLNRCIEYLKNENADEKLINALQKVPFEKADNIYEALVSWNFVMYLDNCDNLGCLAKELYDYYNGEDIIYLLENLYDNLDENGGYSTALNTDYNELTIQCLKAAKGKRRPMIELFVDENTPEEVWDTAFDVMRSHGGQPAFYNPEVLLGGLKERFDIPDKDLKCFCGGGCTESQIAGMSNVGSVDAGINLLLIFENCMYNYLPTAKNFEEFYGLYIAAVKDVADTVTKKIRLSQKERAELCPLPMRTFLTDDCIDSETEFNAGGARYRWSIVNFAGTVNTIDSLLAVKELIFDEKKIGVNEFLTKLKNNDEDFLSMCRKCRNSFGIDNENVNRFTYRLTTDVYSLLDNKKPYLGGAFLPASIQFNSQVGAGKKIGATPDGRKSGAPLCDSLGAIFGKDINGPTELLKSVASINQAKLLGTPVLNFNIDETWNNDILKALILSYMKLGGIQVQITCISEKTLLEAYENPDMHRNLVVRVGGYSEYFCRLSDELKKMILSRTIQKCEL